MTRIEVERKRSRSIWPLLLALVLVAAVAVGVWYYMQQDSANVAEDAVPGQMAPPAAENAPLDTL